MNTARPKNLDLFTIRFPLPAIVSILHRISGVILFVSIPIAIWLLQYSLSVDGFESVQTVLHHSLVKLILWCMLLPFIYHLIAGLRHLLSDLRIGTTLEAGRLTAKLVFVAFVAVSIIVGMWIW